MLGMEYGIGPFDILVRSGPVGNALPPATTTAAQLGEGLMKETFAYAQHLAAPNNRLAENELITRLDAGRSQSQGVIEFVAGGVEQAHQVGVLNDPELLAGLLKEL